MESIKNFFKMIAAFFASIFSGIGNWLSGLAGNKTPNHSAATRPAENHAGVSGEEAVKSAAASQPAQPKITAPAKVEADDWLKIRNASDNAHGYDPRIVEDFRSLTAKSETIGSVRDEKWKNYGDTLTESVAVGPKGGAQYVIPSDVTKARKGPIFQDMEREIAVADVRRSDVELRRIRLSEEATLARSAINPVHKLNPQAVITQDKHSGRLTVDVSGKAFTSGETTRINIVADRNNPELCHILVRPEHIPDVSNLTKRAMFDAVSSETVPRSALANAQSWIKTAEGGKYRVIVESGLLPQGTQLVVRGGGVVKVTGAEKILDDATQDMPPPEPYNPPPGKTTFDIKGSTFAALPNAPDPDADREDAQGAYIGAVRSPDYYNRFNAGYLGGRGVGQITGVTSGHGLPHNTNNPNRTR